MKKLKDQLKSISRSLSTLSKQVDKALNEVDTLKPAKAAPARQKKVTAKKTVAKRKAPARKKKVAAKKTVAKKKAPARQITVLDTVLNAIQRTKKGVTIAKLKENTKLDPRQLSNALYKLSNKGLIIAKARGLYAKK
jgi:predicted Rossmann fold nucleotide-binding protein DprA/Smf involved in DNA uptake